MQLVLLANLLTQAFVFASEPLRFGCPVDEIDEAFRLEWLLDEVDRPFPHRRNGGVEVAMPRNHEDRDRRIPLLYFLQKLDTVELRSLQPDVEQHHRGAPLLDGVECLTTVGCSPYGIAFVLKHSAHQLADVCFIVHNQYFKSHQASSSVF